MTGHEHTESAPANGQALPAGRGRPTAAGIAVPGRIFDRRAAVAVQALAGNRALGALLGGPSRAASVQRFVGTEHAALGDSTGATIDLGSGVVLTWGQMVAIAGDEYGSVEDVIADSKTPAGRARLRAALEHDGVPGALAGTLPPTSTPGSGGKTAKQEQDDRYNDLVVANVAHFAAGGSAIPTWSGHHQDALAAAMDAGLAGDPAAFQLALAKEAFGEHFLTDSFSGGHVRTPRAEILDWYTKVFGPKVVVKFADDLRSRLTRAFAAQIAKQVPSQVSGAVPPIAELATSQTALVMELILGAGGLTVLGQQLGTYVAGAVSGTLHDMEGERGVWVSSVAHPTPWVAYGDARMKDSPDSRSEAESAIKAAKSQVEQAHAIGLRFRSTVAVPFAPPRTVYFGFNHADLDASGSTACQSAADYLRVHPEATVDLVGHTDSVGTDSANDALGTRRAETVKATLLGGGVEGTRITTTSHGEREPVTEDPAQYRLNRRVELSWGSKPSSTPSREREEAFKALIGEIPTPYPAVLDHVPKETPALNVTMEEWHWGSMPKNLQTGLQVWMNKWIKPMVTGLLAGKNLDPILVPIVPGVNITLEPRAVATTEATDLFVDPAGYLGRSFGTPAGP